MADDQRPLVAALLPDLAAEMVAALRLDASDADLAVQVPFLEFWGRCGCSDAFCASFYTGPRSRGTWLDEGEHANVVLLVSEGMVVLDVVNRAIRYVEVLDRPDVKRLVEPLPPME